VLEFHPAWKAAILSAVDTIQLLIVINIQLGERHFSACAFKID
jgi:hypothetical protein